MPDSDGFHKWEEIPTRIPDSKYEEIICPHCMTVAWRHKAEKNDVIFLIEPSRVSPSQSYLRVLEEPEKKCGYMLTKHVMES